MEGCGCGGWSRNFPSTCDGISGLPTSSPMWLQAFRHWLPTSLPEARWLAWVLCTLAKQGRM